MGLHFAVAGKLQQLNQSLNIIMLRQSREQTPQLMVFAWYYEKATTRKLLQTLQLMV